MSNRRFSIATTLALTISATHIPTQAVEANRATSAPKSSATKTPKRYTIEQFSATTNYGGASFSADGKRILFHSNETGIFNVYAMPVEGGRAEAITKSTTDSTYAVSFFPDDDPVLFTRDQGGNENDHLYVRERDGSEKDFTPGHHAGR